jgi:hypothetical protein
VAGGGIRTGVVRWSSSHLISSHLISSRLVSSLLFLQDAPLPVDAAPTRGKRKDVDTDGTEENPPRRPKHIHGGAYRVYGRLGGIAADVHHRRLYGGEGEVDVCGEDAKSV